jgi:hypothetical protein
MIVRGRHIKTVDATVLGTVQGAQLILATLVFDSVPYSSLPAIQGSEPWFDIYALPSLVRARGNCLTKKMK